MLFRSLPIGSVVVLSLACVACEGAGANDVFSGDRGSPSTGRSDPAADERSAPLVALPLAACIPAGYTLPVSIGGSESLDVTVDTGSTSLGVASVSCSGCDVEPKFSPSDAVRPLGVEAKARYAIGGWSGRVYEGEVTLDAKATAVTKFVAIEEHERFFGRQTCSGTRSGGVQGILGLGPAAGAIRRDERLLRSARGHHEHA